MGRSGSALNSNGSMAGSDGGNGTRGDGVAGTAAATGGKETIDDAGVYVWGLTGTGPGAIATGTIGAEMIGAGVVSTGVTGVGTGDVCATGAGSATIGGACHLTDEGVSSAATNPCAGAR
jgi:hypothetical protein